MRILLVNPPYAASEPPRIPMGLLYIGGTLEREGHEVRVLDLLVHKCDRETVRRTIEDFDPALVGITSVTMNWPDATEILKWVKEIDPGIATVAGGPHATFTWPEIGANEPWVDYVVMGEGELTTLELVDQLDKNGGASGIPGLVWREEGGMVVGPKRELIPDLGWLPQPARHLFPLSRYRAMWVGGGLTTGRGCPFKCIFCVGPKMVGGKARMRDPKTVVDEMEHMVRIGFRDIAFSDDHFGMKRSHAFAVCDEIIARNLDVELSIFIRADAAEPELLDRMRKAGCVNILYGAESGVQRIVDLIRKKTDLNMLREKVNLALSMDFQVQVTFIMGLPGETSETIRETMDYARSLQTFFGMHVLAPLPGSELFERADELGLRIFHNNWSLYDANHVVSETDGIGAAELEKAVAELDDVFDRMNKMEYDAWTRGELDGVRRSRFERGRCKTFFWDLFRAGFFDGADCAIDKSAGADPFQALTEKAAALTKIESWEASRWLGRAMDAGDLLLVDEGDRGRLVFSDKMYVNAEQV